MADDITKMLLVIDGDAKSITYQEAERIYHRLSEIFGAETASLRAKCEEYEKLHGPLDKL